MPYDAPLTANLDTNLEGYPWTGDSHSTFATDHGVTIKPEIDLSYGARAFNDIAPNPLASMTPVLSFNSIHQTPTFETSNDYSMVQDHTGSRHLIPESPTGYSTQYGLSFPEQLLAVKEQAARQARRKSDASSAASIVPQVTGLPPSLGNSADEQSTPDESSLLLSGKRPQNGEREFLSSPEEIHYMQVFVEKVGVWMDSFDKDKFFSRLIPYNALKSTMLLNSFLACGVKHLSLFAPEKEDRALFYYNTATTQLLRSLQNPDRNTAECATAAVVLNVYEIMSEKPAQRMSHIAGARALIRECGWDATSKGLGSACFWLNIGMEVLSCLSKDWPTTWDPEQWGLNLNFSDDEEDETGLGHEEVWVHRMFYIVAKIANFRALAPAGMQSTSPYEHLRLSTRVAQWQELKELCDRWNDACPRTMHPLGYLGPSKGTGKSAFPQVW